ncbi:hypothetical protein KCP77_19915 [Salmonella enterica subsp. enterica]|nr:hypothetical protein KCP77_19915 [Salmonella enterica subsp. enterica]
MHWRRRLSQKCSGGNKSVIRLLSSSAKAALPTKASDDEGTAVSIPRPVEDPRGCDERRWAEKRRPELPGVSMVLLKR